MMRLLVVLALLAAPAAAEKVSPVQKVIELLNGMVEKGKKEKHEEQVQFAAYKQFCDDTSAAKQASIKSNNEMIEVLQADIEKAEADAADLGEQIAKHNEDVTTWEGDLKATTKVREIENGMYQLAHKDYGESIEAIADGIRTLKGQQKDVANVGESLAQTIKAPIIPAETKRAIEAFLAQDPDDEDLALEAPEANAYDFASQGIVDMLTSLSAKFIAERTEMEDMEANAVHAYEMVTQDLKGQVERGTKASSEKSEAKAKALQAAAAAKGDLEDAVATRDEDSKYLNDLTATCDAKSSAFAARQTLRAEEIEAVEKAIEIISSGAVSGASEKHLAAVAVAKQQHILAQLRSAAESPTQLRVAAFLKFKANKIDSRVLTALAVHVSADPTTKVRKMIKDMIVKLMEEANEEAEHKGWCDTEMATNEQTRKEKTEAVMTLHAEIDELTSTAAMLAEEIADLTKAVSDSDAAVAEATSIREEEKIKNAATIKDAQAAQTAVAQALAVLKDFYGKAEQATDLIQQPEIFEEPYKGMGAENGGVVGMIEVIQSDFARLESETEEAEASGAKEYEEFMHDSEVDKAQKKSDIEHKKATKQNALAALEEKKVDLEGTEKELTTALAYYEKLKPSCIDAGVSYEDRVARRKEEIESLQEALKILSGPE